MYIASIIPPILLLYQNYKPARGLFIDSRNVARCRADVTYIDT